jgi:adenosylcobinamide-GDP ribazoletransferase
MAGRVTDNKRGAAAWRPHGMDLAEALMLLTRLPVPVNLATPRGAQAAWAWPLAGVVAAGLAAGIGAAASVAGLPSGVVAGLILLTLVLATGALHEDGLADSADGLFGGQTRERRLEILRDSRIGSYGVVALILALGLRWQALTALADRPTLLLGVLLTAAAVSRAAMAGVAWALPPARPDGLSVATGRPPVAAVVLACVLSFWLALGFAGWAAALAATLAAVVAAAVVARAAQARIGGQTGDILGASQMVAECAILIACLAVL